MNVNLELRDYEDEGNLDIDGRDIPYRIVTVTDYLLAKNEDWNELDVEDFSNKNEKVCTIINQIMALKQSCVLLRNTSYSDGSLAEDLFSLKVTLINQLKKIFNYEFDEELVESYTYEEP